MSLFSFTKTVLKSLFSKPATLMYPFVPRKFYENTRGSIAIKIEDCIYCGMCQRKCPTAALSVNKAEKSWSIDRLSCIACNYCVEVCPKKCLFMNKQYSESATAKNKEVFRGA